jgi:CubicO group peptidase (beta-lactamase class C family)
MKKDRHGCALLVGLLVMLSGWPGLALAAASTIRGEYLATLGPLHLKLHLSALADGTQGGTLDSADQGALGIPCADFHLQGNTLSFTVPSVQGSWAGTVAADGATLAGTWDQGGAPMPLTFRRDTFIAASKPSPVDGFWLGTLQAPGQALRIQLSVRSDRAGQESCVLDSLDQSAYGLGCANVTWAGRDLSFDIPAVHGRWRGKLSGDAQTLSGTWTQGASLPLTLQRQPKPYLPPPPPKISYDPAIAPVDATAMQAVLERDFAQALKRGPLAPATAAGVAMGVVRNGVPRVFAWGTATPGSIFEIGSITKTFTGLVLAQMVAQGKVKLDDPVRELLPPGTVARPEGAEITLLDLVTQHSGLPRLPDNFAPADADNPYSDYRPLNLYQFLAAHGVEKPADVPFQYSNLGVGLLGQALADRAGTTYAKLVSEQVIAPLQLSDTGVSLSAGQQARFIQGHTSDNRLARSWDLDALAGAGALRSTATDMLSFLEANLHPESFAASGSGAARTLAAALVQSQQLRADAGNMKIAFAWFYNPQTKEYWHNGATGGYSSYAFFSPQGDYAGVVLLNRTADARGSLADLIGQHIAQRFAGLPAVAYSD